MTLEIAEITSAFAFRRKAARGKSIGVSSGSRVRKCRRAERERGPHFSRVIIGDLLYLFPPPLPLFRAVESLDRR